MHDLANAIAHRVVRGIAGRRGASPRILTYPIERTVAAGGSPVWIGEGAAARKNAAILAYTPLAHELPKYRELVERHYELLYTDDGYTWPATPPEDPYYERFGRQRMRERVYDRLITYTNHVRPIALELLSRGGHQ